MSKTAVTVLDNVSNPGIDSRFGRCQYFAIVESGGAVSFVPNAADQSPEHGAGIQSAQKLSDLNVGIVITGRVGPKAEDALKRLGISAYGGATGTLEDALRDFQAGKLKRVV